MSIPTTYRTYSLSFGGAVCGFATYQAGVLRTVVITTPREGDVAAVMALLPARERNLQNDGLLTCKLLDSHDDLG